MMLNGVYCGDCLELMPQIKDKSVDMILCDLPYGTTACKWDVVIPFEPLWEQYKRIIKDDGAIVLFGSEPFSSFLRMSQISLFKYDWIVEKSRAANYVHAKFQPLKAHETISVFSKSPAAQNTKRKMKYIPQMTVDVPYVKNNSGKKQETLSGGNVKTSFVNDGIRYPRSVIYYSWDSDRNQRFHPTQKPVALFEYLIKTYTNVGDVVLDNCAGSGTTGVACKNLNRDFILIEKDPQYCKIIENRLKTLSNFDTIDSQIL
jgi:site-specific DNA-methyltransferase (adenine-specific)